MSKAQNNKINRGILVYAILYNVISVFFVFSMLSISGVGGLIYVAIFPGFWIIGGVVLFTLLLFKLVKIKKAVEWILLFCSTPLPLLIVAYIGSLFSESSIGSEEYNRNGYRHRKIEFDYSIGHIKRMEYYTSEDSVTDEQPFPVNDVWVKDSIVYYNRKGEIKEVKRF